MSKTILIVDEDRALVQKIASVCRKLGLRVKRAHNAYDAMAIMDDRLPDLVCLDVHMPTGADLSVCQMMATDDEAAQIPLIVITTHKDQRTVELCGGMLGYFLRKNDTLPERVEPFICELVDTQVTVGS